MNLQNETYEDINNNNKENSNVTTDTVNTDDANIPENIATETDKTKSECEQNKEHTKQKKDFINGPFKIILLLICVAVCIVAVITKFHDFNSSIKEVDPPTSITDTVDDKKEDIDKSTIKSPDNSDKSVIVTDVSSIVENALPSVVSISVLNTPHQPKFDGTSKTDDQWDEKSELIGPASGVIIGDNGKELWILTNEHVIREAKSILVTFCDNSRMTAYVKGSYKDNDIAVISVYFDDLKESTLNAISRIKFGDSSNVKIGQSIVAIGNALGYGQSVTTGIISALNRTILSDAGAEFNAIQIDASINPGNSGGVLIDTNGYMIGIPTAKSSVANTEGMGYAVPINDVKEKIETLCAKESKIYATDEDAVTLGINVCNTYLGVMITSIDKESIAYNSKLNVGDIITNINGTYINSSELLLREIRFCRRNDTMNISIKRPDGKEYKNYTINIILK